MAAPEDPEELADIFGCIIHYAVKKGWDRKQVEKLVLKKLAERIEG